MTRALVLLLVLAPAVIAQERPEFSKQAAADSKCGKYRLRLDRASQGPSHGKPGVTEAALTFEMEFKAGPQGFVPQRPDNMFLENDDPFVGGRISTNREIPNNKYHGYTSNSIGSEVTVHSLELGEPQKKLESLTLSVILVHVKTWETVRFSGVGTGDSDYLDCGPFQLRVHGETNKVGVTAASFSDFAEKEKEYFKRVPLRFLTHRYAMDHLVILDATKRPLSSSGYVGSGGMTAGRFYRQTGVDFNSPHEQVPYPLQIEMRLPEEYEMERVVFKFKDLGLPEMQKRQ